MTCAEERCCSAGRVCELFVHKLCGGAAAVASEKEARTLTAAHMCGPRLQARCVL